VIQTHGLGPRSGNVMLLDRDTARRLIDVLNEYAEYHRRRFQVLLKPVVGFFNPPAVETYLKECENLSTRLSWKQHEQMQNAFVKIEIADEFAPLLREALIWKRVTLATDVETRRAHVTHPDLLAKLDEALEPYDELMRSDWFERATAKPAPQLADFFPIESVEATLANELGKPPQRAYDEKFRILQSPSLFLWDLDRARNFGALRSIDLAVAYVDIDNFKAFNSEMTESFVDRNVLPRFMRRVEAHVYTRGFAYRYGGDEYVVLLRNVTEEEALASMDTLREALGELTYEGTERKTTVSVGVVTVRPDCHLTGREIEAAANRAKNFAKAKGRNCVASYTTPFFRDQDLKVTGSVRV
jgi:diguanylate cyclase (GGDEF)-like protein